VTELEKKLENQSEESKVKHFYFSNTLNYLMFMINVTIKVSELKSELEKKENLIENKLKELDIVTEKKVDLEKQVFSLFEMIKIVIYLKNFRN